MQALEEAKRILNQLILDEPVVEKLLPLDHAEDHALEFVVFLAGLFLDVLDDSADEVDDSNDE